MDRNVAVIEQFRAIAELHGDVAFIIDCATGLPTYISASVVALLGYDMADIVDHFKHPQASPALAPLCAGLAARLARFSAGDASRQRLVRCFEQAHPDGRSVSIEVTSTVLCSGGQPTAVVGTLRDVGERRQLAEQQRKFTSMLNHEFRTPLSTIDGAIQRLEVTGVAADDATRQRYRKIQAAVDRLIGMMDEYLSPERMAEVGATRPADAASPAALLREAADLARQAGREIVVELGDLPAEIRCQPGGLRLALKILMDNALQYCPPRHPVVLTAGRADGGIEMKVRDGGQGVPPAELASIFGKRIRGSNASGAGSGLGLYMARSVIEVHGGNISVQNVTPFGAEFRIWLPAQAGAGKSVASRVINSDNSAHEIYG
ncbi:MAG: PAS domain-containing sensor histidine kinase [Bdellovibrionales bacterium]|nr:PAS domain-containing sensor histidine kinase [Massilia sp.]